MKALAAMLVCLASAASDTVPRAFTLVKGHECLDASRIINLPEGVFPEPGFPYGEFALTPYWLPPGATDIAIDADAGRYTGLHAARDAQRGSIDRLPSTILQLDCTRGGFLIDSEAIAFRNRNPRFAAAGGREWNNPHAQYTVTWNIPDSVPIPPEYRRLVEARNPGRIRAAAPAIRPWADPRADPELVLEANVRVPTAQIVGAHANAQFNMIFYLVDTASGKFLSYSVNLFDPREDTQTDQVANDYEFAFVSAQLPRDGTADLERRYFRRSWDSRGSSRAPWPDSRFFRIHVGHAHIRRAIADAGANVEAGGGGLSPDPANYLLVSAGLIQENVYERGERTLVGSSFSDFAVYLARNAR
jgi:hypothetical protein